MDNFQTLDPRKQELLEARFLGMRSTSNPAGTGSGGGGGGNSNNSNNLLQAAASSLQQHHQSMVPNACNNLMVTSQVQQQQQPSPSSSLNASGVPPTQFPTTYSAPASNHGEHGTYKQRDDLRNNSRTKS